MTRRVPLTMAGLMLILGLAVAAAGAAAQEPSLQRGMDPDLRKAIDDRQKAIDGRDIPTVDRLTADDYSAVPVSGNLVTKAGRVAGLKGPAAPTTPTRRTDEAIRVYGAAAVQRFKGDDNRAVWVWAKGPSGWRLAAVQASPDTASTPPPPVPRPPAATPSDWQAPAGMSPVQAAVFAAQKQLQDAFFNGDRATYARLSAPEHVRVRPGGVVRFGLEGSTAIDGPRQRPMFEFHSVQVWDKVAIARWKEKVSGRTTWLMRVFADEGQGWRQVATASTPVASGSTR